MSNKARLVIFCTPEGMFSKLSEQEHAPVTCLRRLQHIQDIIAELVKPVLSKPDDSYGEVIFTADRLKQRRLFLDFRISKHASSSQASYVHHLFKDIVNICKREEDIESEIKQEKLSCDIIPEVQPPSDEELCQLSAEFENQPSSGDAR